MLFFSYLSIYLCHVFTYGTSWWCNTADFPIEKNKLSNLTWGESRINQKFSKNWPESLLQLFAGALPFAGTKQNSQPKNPARSNDNSQSAKHFSVQDSSSKLFISVIVTFYFKFGGRQFYPVTAHPNMCLQLRFPSLIKQSTISAFVTISSHTPFF